MTSKSNFTFSAISRRSVSATDWQRRSGRSCAVSYPHQADQVNRLLLRAGELECGLRDESALPNWFASRRRA